MKLRFECVIILCVLTSCLSGFAGVAKAENTSLREHYSVTNKQYLSAAADTYVKLYAEGVGSRVYEYYYKIPKGTVLGYITYEADR